MKKATAFEINYTRADEPESNYNRTVPPDLFAMMYPGFPVISQRGEAGDSAMMVLGLERWIVKVI